MHHAVPPVPVLTLGVAECGERFPVNRIHCVGRNHAVHAIAVLSQYEKLEPGDLILTGAPEGVNAVLHGDVQQGAIGGLEKISVNVAP